MPILGDLGDMTPSQIRTHIKHFEESAAKARGFLRGGTGIYDDRWRERLALDEKQIEMGKVQLAINSLDGKWKAEGSKDVTFQFTKASYENSVYYGTYIIMNAGKKTDEGNYEVRRDPENPISLILDLKSSMAIEKKVRTRLCVVGDNLDRLALDDMKIVLKQGCYIATCVYGSDNCPEVRTLRQFRDNTLDKTRYGRAFIHVYYATSPHVVKFFGNKRWFNKIWKPALDKIVIMLHRTNKGIIRDGNN